MRSTLVYFTLPVCALMLNPSHAQWQQVASGTTDSLMAITQVDGRFLVAGGGLTFLRSMDDGESFGATAGYAPSTPSTVIDMLAFHDSLVGYGSASYSQHQRTNDGGLTWTIAPEQMVRDRMRIPINGSDQVIFRESAGTQIRQDGLLVAETLAPLYADMNSTCPHPRSLNCPFHEIIGEDTIFSTYSYVWTLTSDDRGQSVQTGLFQRSSYFYSSHVIRGDTIAYEAFGGLFISHDKGVTWLRRTSYPQDHPMRRPAFRMYSAARGLAWGSDSVVYRTTDSAMTWVPVIGPLPHKLNDLLYIDEDKVLAVGDQGTIMTSLDGGLNWYSEESGTSERLHALAASANTILAVGNNGVILKRSITFNTGTSPTGRAEKGLSIFPNPASGIIYVQIPGEPVQHPKFSITDALGRTRHLTASPAGYGNWSVDVSALANGVYTLEMLQGGIPTRSMFIVAH